MDNTSTATGKTEPSSISTKLTQLALNNLDENFDTLSVSSINRKCLAKISEFTAALNKNFFCTRIGNLDFPYKKFINMGAQTVCDDLNRVSYFFIKLGPYR
jgi:hypothetical protein